MLVAMVWLFMLLIAAYEVPRLWHGRLWGELASFGILWTIGLVLGSLNAAQVSIPSPFVFIAEVHAALWDALLGPPPPR